MGLRLGLDTGGTFTDLIGVGDDGRVVINKVPSTPLLPLEAIGNALRGLAAEGGDVTGSPETLARDPAVVDLLMRRCRAALVDLSPMEQVKKILVLKEPFSVAADEMTVSLKLRRNVILEKHHDKVEAMYRE